MHFKLTFLQYNESIWSSISAEPTCWTFCFHQNKIRVRYCSGYNCRRHNAQRRTSTLREYSFGRATPPQSPWQYYHAVSARPFYVYPFTFRLLTTHVSSDLCVPWLYLYLYTMRVHRHAPLRGTFNLVICANNNILVFPIRSVLLTVRQIFLIFFRFTMLDLSLHLDYNISPGVSDSFPSNVTFEHFERTKYVRCCKEIPPSTLFVKCNHHMAIVVVPFDDFLDLNIFEILC